jgi:hypothetical protein
VSDLEQLRDFLPVRELADASDAGKLPYVDDDLYDHLASDVGRFCRLNPRLIPHRRNPDSTDKWGVPGHEQVRLGSN